MAATPLTLADGSVAEIRNCYAPEADKQGEWSCGVDVRLPDGGALEFTLKSSGWGKSLVPPSSKPRKDPPRGR